MPGFELIGKEEKARLLQLFKEKSDFERGKTVKEFEKAFKDKIGAGYAQAVTSCTAALKVAIEGLELPPGSEIITSAFTFVATAEAIIEAGHVPVFCDIDKTYNIDPEDLKDKISKKTKAIIPVHMYGASCNMDEIMKIAKEHNLLVIEDTAQALGAKYKGRYCGTISHQGCFSFDAGKLIGTGDGGMVITNSEVYYRRAFEYYDHGHQCNPTLPRGRDTRRKTGFNFRMTELQAAVGLAQLAKMEKILAMQKKHYDKLINGITNPWVEFREFTPESQHTYEALVFRLPTSEDVQALYKLFKENGIVTKNLPDAYDWHFAGTWKHILGERAGMTAQYTAALLKRSIALMIYYNMSTEQLNKIVKIINDFHRISKIDKSGVARE